jgi:hypothetical protein
MTFSLYPCGDKKGAIIIGKKKILKRWAEYYDELLDLRESAVENGTQEDTEPVPTIEEKEIAIKKLKNNKATGSRVTKTH